MGSTPNMQVELQQGETVLKESRANLQTDFIMSQGGRLFLTNKRFIFLPARLSIPISAQKAEGIILDLARIKVVEKRKGDMGKKLYDTFIINKSGNAGISIKSYLLK